MLIVVTKKRDRISFNVAAIAPPIRLIIDLKPDKRHRCNDVTDPSFEIDFLFPCRFGRGAAYSPSRTSLIIPANEGGADDQSKN